MPKSIKATPTDLERADEWEAIFGTTTAYLESTTMRTITISDKLIKVYFLDLEVLTLAQAERLYQHLAKKHTHSTDHVIALLAKYGCPVRAQGLIVTTGLPYLL